MRTRLSASLLLLVALASPRAAGPTIAIDASSAAGKVSPLFYGLMTEEINHSYDGGLYAELIRNRAFLDTNSPEHWSVVNNPGAEATIALDATGSFNDKLTNSLRLTVTRASKKQPAGVANEGYWGIPVLRNASYHATLLARSESGFAGPVTVSIVSEDGRDVYASEQFSGLATGWKKFELTLKTGRVKPT